MKLYIIRATAWRRVESAAGLILLMALRLAALPHHVFGRVLKHCFFGFVHAELSSNLIDSFSQDFEQVVRSCCRYYLFRAAVVLIALRWLWELRDWLSYHCVASEHKLRAAVDLAWISQNPSKCDFAVHLAEKLYSTEVVLPYFYG